jgi:hypothetical protein
LNSHAAQAQVSAGTVARRKTLNLGEYGGLLLHQTVKHCKCAAAHDEKTGCPRGQPNLFPPALGESYCGGFDTPLRSGGTEDGVDVPGWSCDCAPGSLS